MFYNARWYDPALGRFAQADSIIPEQAQGIQAWDRYAGMNNNPVRYNDPSGHTSACGFSYSDPECHPPTPSSPPPQPPTTRHPKPCRNCHNSSFTKRKNSLSWGNNAPHLSPYNPLPPGFVSPSYPNGIKYVTLLENLIVDPLIAIGNFGRPVYRQAKGLIPFGAVGEGFVGAGLQILSDLDNPNLTLDQRIGRGIVAGFEDVITDVLSTGAGPVGALAFGGPLVLDGIPLDEIPGAGLGFFVAMAGTNLYLTNKFDEANKTWFPNLGY